MIITTFQLDKLSKIIIHKQAIFKQRIIQMEGRLVNKHQFIQEFQLFQINPKLYLAVLKEQLELFLQRHKLKYFQQISNLGKEMSLTSVNYLSFNCMLLSLQKTLEYRSWNQLFQDNKSIKSNSIYKEKQFNA